MKYTIGTDDYFVAMHLMTISECLEHQLGYLTMPAVESLAFLVDVAGEEFARIDREGPDEDHIIKGKDDPMYGALRDLQKVLRKTEAQISLLLP